MQDFSELRDPDLLSKEEIENLLPILDELQAWAEKVKAFALQKALEGEEFKGYKVVEGRAYQQVTDEQALVDAIGAELTGTIAGESEESYNARLEEYKALCYERKLLSVSRLEALVGKKKFPAICGSYIEKPQGKPALVPEADPREPWKTSSAADDFRD